MENVNLEGSRFPYEDDEDGYDAVVIGSGYGGSVAACRMSMAGLKVCLLEKGKKWEAQDFPTNTFKLLSTVRVENRELGVGFGPKNALFQIYLEDDSATAMACGVGGGSLVNAGVMIPAPVRARRNSRWPEDWERDWEHCEASASAMLRIQSVPIKFQNAKIMEQIVGEDCNNMNVQNPMKLAVNFDIEDQMSNTRKSQESHCCLACGNCLAGCPYNAKYSTDKTYLASAIQAGCIIKTECEVQFLIKNENDTCVIEEKASNRRRRRQWIIFLNDFDYVTSDFVILSAGVFGSAKILFQSQMKGLILSKTLGLGLSCNGNNVAYLAGSAAPLNAYGLDRKQLSKAAFQERPGPSISSSYSSSLGFTIQSAVLPNAYPWLLFKGITTYGWPKGYWFLHGIIDKVKHIFGLDCQDILLNAMGYDDNNGKLIFDKETNKISFQPPIDPLLPRKIEAFQKLTKKLGGILFMSRFRSTSVHLLGGCCAALESTSGVCNPNGQVFDTNTSNSVYPGLYVCDASIIPCSVGINPSLTIATVAEHVSKHLLQDILNYNKSKDAELVTGKLSKKPGLFTSWKSSQRSAVVFQETMRGHLGGMPCTAYLKVRLHPRNSTTVVGKSNPSLKGKVAGSIVCRAVERDRLHIIDGDVDFCQVDTRTPYTQHMHYHLLLTAASGSRYILEGRKVMNPFFLALYAWKESTTLHVSFRKIAKNTSEDAMINLRGQLHVSLIELLKTVISLDGQRKFRFVYILLKSLFRTYISEMPRGSHQSFTPSEMHQRTYASSTLHEIEAEDGHIIKCRTWKCNLVQQRPENGKELLPILLINGYSTESYYLPSEPHDLVRTLLQEGHDVWLLYSRLHPTCSSNYMTLEDIGRFDIPAAINKILELHGTSAKVHVIAHCVGGLAIHVALMGGHISCNRIASLSCTNSSMFFKLTASSIVKMWLPLIPMSMAILGRDKTVPLFGTSKASFRRKLLRSIARAMPRCERCTCDECEVFSGIFGNTFWHQNISHTMHYWLNKENLPRFCMAAFPHLRKICKAGFIVDSKGKNSYLIHPERMALPTLYISGGHTLLVTPETSFLANKYMKLHQPGFRHERVVIEGFGHSDLLIGEESYNKVFPHILHHIELAEKEQASTINPKERKCSKDALSWCKDPFEDGGVWSGVSALMDTLVLVFLMICLCIFPLLVFKAFFKSILAIGF